ncbi:MAG: tRNA (adenosine(37)-N6)-threonylcarbamoyltransferase complex ATPase subunit type 1 TsaE [Candidatus Omnitrophica bacterium]|nr:tRNA (adenosine(37)-N6)-threonylcarbamoyltransferase complex ATPase subunit type 1 TsaE [Candidatus Omnitrophota bacterium]
MEIISHSVNDTLKIGRRIAKKLQKGDIICLFGEFGSGKTVFTKGIASGLGIKKAAVISPSFVLIRQYPGRKLTLHHLDLYRLKTPKDILTLGYQEYLYDEAATVIEWADKLGGFLPDEYLGITLKIKGQRERRIKIIPHGRHYRGLSNAIQKEIQG